jgi:alcohol dehydrogenase class IV
MEFNRSAAAGRLADIGAILTGDSNAPAAERVEAAISGVRQLNAALGIPGRLRDAGVNEEVLVQVSKRAFEDASHLANPRPCTEADLLSLARAAF